MKGYGGSFVISIDVKIDIDGILFTTYSQPQMASSTYDEAFHPSIHQSLSQPSMGCAGQTETRGVGQRQEKS